MPEKKFSEGWFVFIIGAIQFINILDFMMVMPLGPDFAIALNIPTRDIGWVAGSYTFAAALAGFICATFLDNYRRKKVLMISLFGLMTATLLCAFAWDFHSLMAARFLAGAFGGPLSAAAISMVADFIPPQRRGAVMGKVMGAFSIASIIGVPFGLELASRIGWQAPFFAVGLFGYIILYFSYKKLPESPNHPVKMNIIKRVLISVKIFRNPISVSTYLFFALAMFAGFMIIPNISTHLQFNLHHPREKLGMLYFLGGIVSLFGMRFAGKMIDKTSSVLVSAFGTILLVFVLVFGFIYYHSGVSAYILFPIFMLAMTTRNVANQTLSSKVPPPHERVAFTSMQNAIIHLATSLGAFASTKILSESPTHQLLGVETIAIIAIIAFVATLPIMFYVERKVQRANPKPAIPEPELLA